MLTEKQQVGEKFSLVNQGEAEPLKNNAYQEITYRRVIPFSEEVQDFEVWKNDIKKSGSVVISKEYEKISGQNNLLPISFLKKGNECCEAVCRIVTPTGYGTGFLITGGYIMTNNHVIKDEEEASVSYAEFFYEEGREAIKVHFKIAKLFITNELLDYTIIACDYTSISEVKPIELNSNVAMTNDYERVSIIQHPRGRRKEIALQDNEVIYIYDKVIHYRTDTEVGASGSPVFNKDWELVALHHAGWYENDGRQAVNEGILISTIIVHLQKVAFSNSPYRDFARKILNSIEKSSPILGFFDINGLVDYDDENYLEVEVPSHRGNSQFADVGFWNIEHFNNNVANSRVKKVADVVANLSLDVLGVVEVEKKSIEKLIEELRRRGISLKYEYLDASGSQDIAVLYDEITTKVKKRDDINDKYKRLLSKKTSKNKSAFPRKRHPLFVECHVKENDKETKFLMVVVHLKAFGDSTSKSRRKLASEILAVIIDDIRRNENIPILLGGDFNQKLDNSGVLNSLTKAPDLFTLTVDDSKDNAITYVGNRHKSLIDHIIVSDDVLLGEISNDDAAIVRLDKGVANFVENISDHVPVVCRIIYNKKKEQVTPTYHSSSNLDDDYQIGMLNATNNADNISESDYYDSSKDEQAIKDYYGTIFDTDITTSEFFFELRDLVDETHVNRYSYRTARLKYLYPIVDIRENGKLKSIYKQTNTYFEVEEVLKKDYEIERELMMSNTDISEKDWEVLEAYQPFNCEHVVCQSWFNRKEPMKSDLHHLFTCESGCNSSRGNKKYFDFSHYKPDEIEALRAECGYGEDRRFEPESGKGAVARATLYFILRYPKVISSYKPEDLKTLLDWHKKYKVSTYEKHRNFEIHKIQGNRNPFIDFPEECLRLDIEEGLR